MKKGFTLIELMIVVAIIAILAMIAVPMYQRYIERSRNAASQALLQQISLAEVALDTAPETMESFVYTIAPFAAGASSTISTAADAIEMLATFGFRPDPNVAFAIEEDDEGAFRAFAGHITIGSPVFVYDNTVGSGVLVYDNGYNPTNPVGVGGAMISYRYDGAQAAGSRVTVAASRTMTAPTGAGTDNAAKIAP